MSVLGLVSPRSALRGVAAEAELRRWRRVHVSALYERIWRQAADLLGANLRRMSVEDLELSLDGRVTRVRWEWTELESVEAQRRALDKPLVHRLLTERNVPLPAAVQLTLADPRPGFAFLRREPAGLVVKPSRSGGGFGVTCGVRRRTDLIRACLAAARYDGRLVAERHVAGDVYRVLVLDGEPLAVVRKRPPRLVGDGRSSIGALIESENRRRLQARGAAGICLIRPDLDLVLTLRDQGFGLRSVAPTGRSFAAKRSTGDAGAEDADVVDVDRVPGLTEAAVRAAAAVGLRLAGVDLATPDPHSELSSAGGAVLEVNATPGLHHHYLVADTRQVRPVALPILERLLGGKDGAV